MSQIHDNSLRLAALFLVFMLSLVAGCNQSSLHQNPGSMEHRVIGIGIKVKEVGSRFVISSVLPDSPASKAGLIEGDVLVVVRGQGLEGRTLRDVIEAVRGAAGAEVELQLQKPSREVRTMNIKRTPLVFKHEEIEQLLLEPTQLGCPDSIWRSCSCPGGCDQSYYKKECTSYGPVNGRCLYRCSSCYCSACA